MKDYIEQRTLLVAKYLLKNGATVRLCAREFGISKTTVHKDMRERLPRINPDLAEAVERVLLVNKAERHLRGGAATRRKYELMGRRRLPDWPDCAIMDGKEE